MHKYDRNFLIGIFVFFIIIYIELSRAFVLLQVEVNTQDTSNIYFYGVEDSQIQNPELLTYFVDNVKAGLNTSLTIYMIGDYEEDLMYGILYKEDKFIVYTSINNEIVDTQSFCYLNNYNYNGYTYYFLSNNEQLDEVLVGEYFMGDIFEMFEVGREKIE